MNTKMKFWLGVITVLFLIATIPVQAQCCLNTNACKKSCVNKTDKEKSNTKSKVQFFETTYEHVLEQAKNRNKKIFVDAYANWCAPCKKLDKTTLSDTSVINYLNRYFINYKTDVETIDGLNFSEKFNIQEYPTLLILNESGKILDKVVGYKNSVEFLNWLKKNN